MNIAFDFPLFLVLAVFITGIISLFDLIFLRKKRIAAHGDQGVLIEYSRSFFPVLLLVLLIRSFVIQPYRVPTGSLAPTILPGDFIVVNQFAYGLRLPVLNTKIMKVDEPKLGDIALFRWPPNPHLVFIKRVIGTPGDHIAYKNKKLYINGKLAPQKLLDFTLDDESGMLFPVIKKQEILPNGKGGIKHDIFIRQNIRGSGNFDIVVPKGKYFMMGDNRDGSDDSRDWGFVPEQNLIGKAMRVWFSWSSDKTNVRWHRIGQAIK